jgi:hypothetical protein
MASAPCRRTRNRGEAVPMLAFFLLLILAWFVLGLIGFVVKGLFWLFLLACVLFVLTLIFGGSRSRSGG